MSRRQSSMRPRLQDGHRVHPGRIVISVVGALGGALWGFGAVFGGVLLETGFGINHGPEPTDCMVAAVPFVLPVLFYLGPGALYDALWIAPLFWGIVGLTLVDLRSRWMALATLALVALHGWGVYLFQAVYVPQPAGWLFRSPGTVPYLAGLFLLAPIVVWKAVVLASSLPAIVRALGPVARRSSRPGALKHSLEFARERGRSGARRIGELMRALGRSRRALLLVVLACLISIAVVRWQLRWTGHYLLPPSTAIGAGYLLRFGLPLWLAPHLVSSVSNWSRHRSGAPPPERQSGHARLLFDLLAAVLWIVAFLTA